MILKLIIKEFQDQINTSLGGEATWARITEMAWGIGWKNWLRVQANSDKSGHKTS